MENLLENDYTQEHDHHPKTITSAYSLLMNWKQDACNIMIMAVSLLSTSKGMKRASLLSTLTVTLLQSFYELHNTVNKRWH
jgi:hypothetical protein